MTWINRVSERILVPMVILALAMVSLNAGLRMATYGLRLQIDDRMADELRRANDYLAAQPKDTPNAG